MEADKESKSNLDKILIGLALIGMLVASLPLMFDSVDAYLFSKNKDKSAATDAGSILRTLSDARLKTGDSITWQKAKANESVHIGDSVFTGDRSELDVKLVSGGQLHLDPNSMVTFSTVDSVQIPTFVLGTVKLEIKGDSQVLVAGKIVHLKGTPGSQVEIKVKDNKPIVHLTKGMARVETAPGQTEELVEEKPKEVLPVIPPAPPEPAKLTPVSALNKDYTDHLYDFYETKNGSLHLRDTRRTFVHFPVSVRWQLSRPVDKVYGQLSSNPGFQTSESRFSVAGNQSAANFENVYIGDNYYRLSQDGRGWLAPQKFTITAQPLKTAAPSVRFNSNHVFVLDKPATISLSTTADKNLLHFAVEMSESPSFSPGETKVYWVSTDGLNFNLNVATTFYVRARGADVNGFVTGYSEVSKVVVEKPPAPGLPLVKQNHYRIQEGETLRVAFTPGQSSSKTEMEVRDLRDKSRQNVVLLKGDSVEFKGEKQGRYELSFRGLDRYGRRSTEASRATVQVDPKPNIPIAKREEPKRIPAAIATNTAPLDGDPWRDQANDHFRNSKLSFEGAAFTMISKEQLSENKSNPTALIGGVRILNWFDNGPNGIEGSLKTKLVNISSSPGANVQPAQIEGRYHYRWLLPYNPFSNVKAMQLSAVVGNEFYKNFVSGPFSPQYDLFKAGVALTLPVLRRWDTGGEILYGAGFDGSHKYELSGFLNYYLEANWSLGVGYRMHLFEAGSNSSSPEGLPFREGYGEGYSSLRWSY